MNDHALSCLPVAAPLSRSAVRTGRLQHDGGGWQVVRDGRPQEGSHPTQGRAQQLDPHQHDEGPTLPGVRTVGLEVRQLV